MKRATALALASVFLLSACPDREEVLQKAEDTGKLMAEKKARMAKGLGDGLQKEGKEAGESVMKGAAGVLKGMVQGAQEGFSELPVEVAGPLAAAGMKVERAARHDEGHGAEHVDGVKVYVVTERAFTGRLVLVARDGDAREVGRSTLELAEAQPTGRYVFFPFEKLADLSLAEQLELTGTVGGEAGAAADAKDGADAEAADGTAEAVGAAKARDAAE